MSSARELAGIEGFDDETAEEIQARAQDYLARIEAEHDEARKALGVADELKEIDGLTTPMLVKLGQNGVKSVEDLAGCASDDLIGWSERTDAGEKKFVGYLERIRPVARAGRRDDHGGARPRRLGRRSRRRGRRKRAKRARRATKRRRTEFEARRRLIKPDAIEESGPERTCAATGWKGPPEAMLRFALSGDGVVTPDIRRRLPGRGVWIRLDAAAVRQAAAKQVFARAFRAKAEAPPGLADDVDRLLEADALQFLSLVNKAGSDRDRRVQGRGGDRRGQGRRPHPRQRRLGRRGPQARSPAARPRRRGCAGPADQYLCLAPIGFGAGEDKCDTCSAHRGRGQRGLSREGGAFDAISDGRRDAFDAGGRFRRRRRGRRPVRLIRPTTSRDFGKTHE